MKKATTAQINDVLAQATARKEQILNSASCYPENRPTYYVDSLSGNDMLDGKTPETAWRSIDKVGNTALNSGDVVLFKRGCVWRGTMRAQDGVTYSAYGEGKKPEFYGSIDASDPNDWVETMVINVWLFRHMIAYVKEAGSVIINGGKLWGIKICENRLTGERCDMQRGATSQMGVLDVFNGRKYVHRERGPFNSLKDIKGDLEFYHNYFGKPDMLDDHLYLNCPDGNPGQVFESIEISLRYSVFAAADNATFDNLCFKYAGVHGMSCGHTNNVVRNCEFAWLGGSGMFPEAYAACNNPPFGHDTTRLGNGAEVYGECKGFVVENCYFHQIYDTAVTSQMHTTANQAYEMRDIKWNNNLFDRCACAFELWMVVDNPEAPKGQLKNVEISNNIILNTGLGWSHQRCDWGYAAFLTWGVGTVRTCDIKNVSLNNNIFFNDLRYVMFTTFTSPDLLNVENNKIFSAGNLGLFPEDLNPLNDNTKDFDGTEENLKLLEEKAGWKNTEYYLLDKKAVSFDNAYKI